MNLIQNVDWAALAPPLVTAVAAVVVLVADLFLPAGRKAPLAWVTVGGLALALAALAPLWNDDRTTFCLADDPGLCSYSADRFALLVQLLVLGGALLAALLTVPELRGAGEGDRDGLPGGEFWFLLLSSASGAALLPAARDLATLVIALEVTTLPAYALVGLRRGSATGPEAALKFFLSSVTATAVGLLGVSFVYAGAGSLFLSEIAAELPEADPQLATLAKAGVALTLVGFVFKVAAVPFHFWVPETYQGAPLPVAGYLSVVGKTAGLAGLALVTTGAFPGQGNVWGPPLAVLAGLTMTVGNVAALRVAADGAHSAVRVLAWSSVGQAGYLLVPLAAAGFVEDGGAARDAVGTALAYALMYGAVNLGAFAVLALVVHDRRAAPPGTGRRVVDFRGLFAERPLAALALAFFLLCLAGLPPGVIGLFAKVAVFRSAVDAGLGVLAVVMALNVAVALGYYLRWTALLFQPGPEPQDGPGSGAGDAAAPAGRPTFAVSTAIALAASVALVLSGAPQLILTFTGGGL
ncbi:NADH-quinone oxidoreductase subunit N [Streptomyces sp. 3MP-14]|uniref:NADH-quinone oxidoreductase subunit N n=1 Tax=Streptomyces mimosae TaxID=2586635 RepID=A0A5N6AFV9_9ACTN|nr:MULTISPECIES: NADH-quinone oxidoreductase subunit N [Streptomyces]KAB8167135.1 NADH-quinone oxidoreductase subunit N [Streptomyces mimosae]KAB8177076.1 NADH-quinone oxidoreductase subunit N [Streptomyces sp. 3MP-14]